MTDAIPSWASISSKRLTGMLELVVCVRTSSATSSKTFSFWSDGAAGGTSEAFASSWRSPVDCDGPGVGASWTAPSPRSIRELFNTFSPVSFAATLTSPWFGGGVRTNLSPMRVKIVRWNNVNVSNVTTLVRV